MGGELKLCKSTFGQGSGLMFMANGCEIANAPMWKGLEYRRAPLRHCEARADAESQMQCLGWAHLGARLQLTVHVPRGPNPAQLGLQDASASGWPGCAVAAPRSMG